MNIKAILKAICFLLPAMLPACMSITPESTETVTIDGSVGKIVGDIHRPATKEKTLPVAIIYHGCTGNRTEKHLRTIADSLLEHGIATVMFDFNGHGQSDGDFYDMTWENEVEDAKLIYEYTASLPWVDKSRIAIAGHSQGGIVAGVAAGDLGKDKVRCAVLMSPATHVHVLATEKNYFFGKEISQGIYPDSTAFFGGPLFSKEYAKVAYEMDVYSRTAAYKGDLCVIQGLDDDPDLVQAAEGYRKYLPESEYHPLYGLSHCYDESRPAAAQAVTSFILKSFGMPCSNTSARWISTPGGQSDGISTWTAFRKDVTLSQKPKRAIAKIAVDSKYWLWIDGEIIIREGGLKRGPNPRDTYYDEVDLAPYLHKGVNQIAVLVWHFGKMGFSHKDSGKGGLFMDVEGIQELCTDSSWKCRIHPAFSLAEGPLPNYRLPESNIRFDAGKDIPAWQTDKVLSGFQQAEQISLQNEGNWGSLVKRPIPQFVDYGIEYSDYIRKEGSVNDTITVHLPYNMQFTPVFEATDPTGGNRILIQSDHAVSGGAFNIYADYITKKGSQEYESPGWINGDWLYLIAPKEVQFTKVGYRQSGYDTFAEGTFDCDDDFLMRYWQKALRTLYVNMRDTFFDCPDRERAQWWGDVVILMGESFYTYSTSVHDLMRKAILELAAWQKPDGVLHSPIPEGNYGTELPGQMLASIGRYGFWNYYMNTGDIQTIRTVYPAAKKYLSLWETDETGLTCYRAGGWTWGDWGTDKDMRLILACWHSLALDGAEKMATLLGYTDDAEAFRQIREGVKKGYNQRWNGSAYRAEDYTLDTDDRVQALAVLAGIADPDKYDAIFETLKAHEHASPYTERYVMEALFEMDYGNYAMDRMRKRYAQMTDDQNYTTLFEGWGIGEDGFGGGTWNHAWSGGPLTVIAQKVCGIYPTEPGFKRFTVDIHPVDLKHTSISFPTVSGTISSSWELGKDCMTLNLSVPKGCHAEVKIPQGYTKAAIGRKEFHETITLSSGEHQVLFSR